MDTDAYASASSGAAAAPHATAAIPAQDYVRASVTAALQPHFDNEASLKAYLFQLPEEQRAEKLAAKCGVQLGKAALYVQRFCAPGAVQTLLSLPCCLPLPMSATASAVGR
jgi:hypothetical protein